MGRAGFLVIGKIIGAHGVKGAIRVRSFTESAAVFSPQDPIMFRLPDGREKTHEIEWARPHGRNMLLSLKGVCDRDQATGLIGAEILFKRDRLPEPEEGAFYWSDLIGLAVFNAGDQYLGQVTAIIPTGSNDVYVVQDREKKKEILVPALEWVVHKIDLEKKVMQVTLPEGLA